MLSRVHLTSEVFRTCVTHALTTEAEEVMGLLLGDVLYEDNGNAVARVWVAMPQIRTDRRKDRVEASPEQLAQATAAAESFSEAGQRQTRVIGWYHSHPHITVLPSHVDVRTQAMYQGLDGGFIGLIFSVFNQSECDAASLAGNCAGMQDGESKTQSVKMTAFQSMQQGFDAAPISQKGSWDFDSSMAAAISASVEEARANAAIGGQWIQRKVPLAVVPSMKAAEEATLRDLIKLCQVLFEEERHAFRNARQEAFGRDGKIDPLTAIHQAAEYQQHLARLIELVLAPARHSVEASQLQAQIQQQQLRDVRDRLEVQRGGPLFTPPSNSEVENRLLQREDFPDAAAPLTAAHFSQTGLPSAAASSAQTVTHNDWMSKQPVHSASEQLSETGSTGVAAPQQTAQGLLWQQLRPTLGPSVRVESRDAESAEPQGSPKFEWPARTNWDTESPLSNQGQHLMEGARVVSQHGHKLYAPTAVEAHEEKSSQPSLSWREAMSRSEHQRSSTASPAPGQSIVPREPKRQHDPFGDLLDSDLAALNMNRHSRN